MKFRGSVFTQILPVTEPDAHLFPAQAAAFAQELNSLRLQHDAGAAIVEHTFRTLVDRYPQPGGLELETCGQSG